MDFISSLLKALYGRVKSKVVVRLKTWNYGRKESNQ